ncbi:Non-specific serine/threonine protein kinase protein [Dioscorea alata]|uniref:Non-specific serine/threonine protein kinase protein n=1 Tax=Dioscorea alata TaxID=55571 RepID=A0ACB7WTP5_DIOAL|nr:Non-specific serine/threonine protein kinase protein [Dioscorea alata]
MESWLPSKFTTILAEILMLVLLSQLVLFFSNLCFPVPIMVTSSKTESHGRALLQWKATLETQDLLLTWTSMVNPCNWTGITCKYDALPKLTTLDLFGKNLRSIIPSELGNLTRLKTLWLSQNQISGSIPTSFAKLRDMNLLTISKNFNRLSGSIPNEIGNLVSLTSFDITDNQIIGLILPSLGSLKSLIGLALTHNYLFGKVPDEFSNLTNLNNLQLVNNNLSGNLPRDLARRGLLNKLASTYNNFQGSIPTCLKNSTNLLQLLGISSNNLVGKISKEFDNSSFIFHLNMSNNHLTGTIPQEFVDLYSLELEHCLKLNSLKFDNNELSGVIPSQLCDLNLHDVLDLSDNIFTGKIPTQLNKSLMLQKMNLSHNDLAAPIEWFTHNKGLCGQVLGLPRCNQSSSPSKCAEEKYQKVIILTILPIFNTLFLLLLLVAITLLHYKRKKKLISNDSSEEVGAQYCFSIWNVNHGKETYKEIIRATEDFDSKYQIGVGACSIVYKAVLSSGETLAIKKFHIEEDRVNEQAFRNEIQALTEIQHMNTMSFLAYKYMKRGSMGVTLTSEQGTMELDWIKRVNILAYVMRVAKKCDVYSFGIVALELINGAHPGDLFSNLSLSMLVKDILDPCIPLYIANQVITNQVFSVISIAMQCINTNPQARPVMQQVSQRDKELSTIILPIIYDYLRSSFHYELRHSYNI